MTTKILVGLLCFAFLSSSWSLASDDNGVTVSGQFRIRSEGDNKTDFGSDRDFTLLRVRPVIKFKKSQELEVIFAPQFTRVMGEANYLPSGAAANSKTGMSGSTTDPYFNVHEAYATYLLMAGVEFKAGRMVLNYGDELVIGGLEWNNVGRSFDAFKLRFTHAFGWTDLFASKVVEGNASAPTSGDNDFFGLYNGFQLGEYFKSVDLYMLYQKDATGPMPSHLGATGVRAASKVDQLDYRAEFTKEFGNAFSDSANSQFDAEAGYTFTSSMKPRLGVEYLTAGKSYNQLYPTVHKWLGFADLLGRRNISGFVIHSEAQVLDSLKAKVDYHVYSRTETSASAFKANGSSIGTASGSTAKDLGTEIDLTLVNQTTKDLKLVGGASYFQSGSYFKDQYGDVNPTFYYIQMEVSL